MKRPAWIWMAFALCVAVASAAMAWVHETTLRLERAEAASRRRAALEESLRLALWRMDSALAPLIAEESTRPYFHFGAFYPAERAYTSMFAEIRKGDVLMPSPLLGFDSPRVRLHFQYTPDGRLGSPQAPAGNMRDLAEARYVPPGRIEASARRLDELAGLVRRGDLLGSMSVRQSLLLCAPGDPPAPPEPVALPGPARDLAEARGSKEFQMRTRSVQQARVAPQAVTGSPAWHDATPVVQGPLRAVWIGDELILARKVRVGEGEFLQGCWLDWPAIRSELTALAADLLPRLDLEPVRSLAAEPEATRMLATLPVRLRPGPAPLEGEASGRSTAALTLGAAWGCLAIAAMAVALLLHGAVSLGERRGAFVSAVTHELRTPLTTFRLYAEMLAEGMVDRPEARQQYLDTLRTEADRLGHLVENVLGFARLERGRAARRSEVVSPAQLLDRLDAPLTALARQGGMELRIAPADASARLRTDLTVVDQILSNLVDNAAKYARAAGDRRIHVEAEVVDATLAVAVRDHGPGLDPRMARRLFRPFSKSASEAARSAPGIGLGLALSRRLARSLGGDLRLRRSGADGACFLLTLPLLRPQESDEAGPRTADPWSSARTAPERSR